MFICHLLLWFQLDANFIFSYQILFLAIKFDFGYQIWFWLSNFIFGYQFGFGYQISFLAIKFGFGYQIFNQSNRIQSIQFSVQIFLTVENPVFLE